jgi:hypothetical protein
MPEAGGANAGQTRTVGTSVGDAAQVKLIA